MQPYLLGLYEKSMPNKLTFREKLLFARISGYDYLEMSIDETDEKLERLEWDKDKIADLRSALYETGMPIKSICLSGHRRYPLGHPDTNIQEQALCIMQKAISLAVQIGVRIIQLAGYDVYYEKSTDITRKTFSKNLERCVNMASKEGIILGFETMETPFLDTTEKAMKWVSSKNSPYLQVYPDVGNLTNSSLLYGTNVEEDLEKGAGHLVAIHLKETTPGIYREVPYGQGHVNFSSTVKKCWQLGVRMYVGEFWYKDEKNWSEILRANNNFLRSKLNSLL